MAEMFTPAEANALYNRCKISWDPKSYSLRDSLKLSAKSKDMLKHHITLAGFGAERALIGAIFKFHGCEASGRAGIKSVYWEPKKAIDAEGICIGIQPNDACICKKDDMYIALDYLEYCGFPKTTLKTSRMLEAIVQTCIALSSNKSCSADLHWLACDGFASQSYEDLHNFKKLTDALASKSNNIPAYPTLQPTLCQFVPSVNRYHACKGPMNEYGLDSTKTKEFEECTVQTQMLYTLYYFLEVVWATKTLSDSHLKDLINTFLHSGKPVGGSYIEKLFYDFSHTVAALNPEIDRVTSIENPKERFDAYRELAKTLDFDKHVDVLTKAFLGGDVCAFVSTGFGILIGFTQTYSNTWVRINSCRILYEYAMSNNLLDDKDFHHDRFSDGLSELAGATGTGTASPLAPPVSEKESSDLMSLTVGHKDCSGGAPGAGSYTSPTYEALDKAKSKYVDGRYEFDTQDITDFGDDARIRYESIARKVSLVNRTLTQKLREIKTYNTGGKQAGLPSGRLDRKAVYRYQYDPNIFYNNTYKQLESDLAFGVVLDISGSMHGKGIENGRITMIVLHETLKALGINHSIIGHTSHGSYKCTIERYQSFREDKTYRTRKNYALANLEAQNGNCDSASLFYMEKALLRAKNRDKICVIFSDGQPTECTGTDLREQVAHMERNGIKVIGIGIDFPEIADYYKDYANGKNLTDMLNIVTKILKEYILKKKERA
jgi:hypothetical protein